MYNTILLGGATILTLLIVIIMVADLRFQHKQKNDIVKQIRKRRKEVLLVKQKKRGNNG